MYIMILHLTLLKDISIHSCRDMLVRASFGAHKLQQQQQQQQHQHSSLSLKSLYNLIFFKCSRYTLQ
ncbi:hypothetical protein BLOT_007113 [Blomia tropicalis]|nr:hypothetical protein BLOT_007113 [Blomia tropicalis]